MKVLIDADGCPVTTYAAKLCNDFNIPCLIFCDTSHILDIPNTQILIADKGSDSVDFALVKRVGKEDVVITQDYGLASMCLAKNARVLHQDGWEYTESNISGLLEQRHAAKKYRMAGGRTKGPHNRTEAQNRAFICCFRKILQTEVHG